MNQEKLQTEINTQIALTLGKQLIELIIAQTTMVVMQAELQKLQNAKEEK